MLPYTHDRIETTLDTMQRLRRIRFIDLQRQTMIDTAYFAVKPPEKKKVTKKVTYILVPI